MSEFEIEPNFRLRMKLYSPSGKILRTKDGFQYTDPSECTPGVSNVYRLARRWCSGKGLDVGASYFRGDCSSNGFPGAFPCDKAIPESGEAYDLIQGDESQDYVFMSHILEHLDEPDRAILEARRVLRPGGYLFTYHPYPGHPDWDPSLPTCTHKGHHKWQPSPTSIQRLMVVLGFDVVYSEHEADQLHSFAVVGRKRS